MKHWPYILWTYHVCTLFLHKNKMKISLVTMPPLLASPVAAVQTQTSFPPRSFRPLSWQVCAASLPREERQEPVATSSATFPPPFPTDSVMPQTVQGFSAEKCNFPIPKRVGWTQTLFALGRDKAGSSGCPDVFALLKFDSFLLRSPVRFISLQ